MSPQAIIKKQARSALKNNYVRALAAFVILLIPVFFIDEAAAAIFYAIIEFIDSENLLSVLYVLVVYPVTLISGVLLSPMLNGYIRAFYRCAYTGELDLRDMFYYFENGRYPSTLNLNLRYILRMILPCVIFFLPLLIYVTVISVTQSGFCDTVFYGDIYFILTVMSVITTTLYSLKYFVVFTLSVENEQLKPDELFRFSKMIMADKTYDATRLIFSFTPWMLLCLLILPMLYVIPYMTQSLCIGAKWMTRATFERK